MRNLPKNRDRWWQNRNIIFTKTQILLFVIKSNLRIQAVKICEISRKIGTGCGRIFLKLTCVITKIFLQKSFPIQNFYIFVASYSMNMNMNMNMNSEQRTANSRLVNSFHSPLFRFSAPIYIWYSRTSTTLSNSNSAGCSSISEFPYFNFPKRVGRPYHRE